MRYLDIKGWHSKDAPRVVPISSNNSMKRLVFAKNHEEEDDDLWDHVVWSDEVTVEACPRNRKVKLLVHCT
jgi:hypothetical protein